MAKINAGVVVKRSYDGKTYYQVREIVTESGLCIEWDGIYTTIESAYQAIRVEQALQDKHALETKRGA